MFLWVSWPPLPKQTKKQTRSKYFLWKECHSQTCFSGQLPVMSSILLKPKQELLVLLFPILHSLENTAFVSASRKLLFTVAALLISLMTMSSSLYTRGVAEPTTLSPTLTFSRTQTTETKLCIEKLSLISVIFEPVLNHHHIFRCVTGYFWSKEINCVLPVVVCATCWLQSGKPPCQNNSKGSLQILFSNTIHHKTSKHYLNASGRWTIILFWSG